MNRDRWKYLRYVLCVTSIVGVIILQNSQIFALEAQSDKDLVPVRNITVENNDGESNFSWEYSAPSMSNVKGVRLYRVRKGTEMGYKIPETLLVEDLNKATSYRVKHLNNGEQQLFILKAYDNADKEFWGITLEALPGTSSTGRPNIPRDLYGSEGDGGIALFWRKNTELDLAGYEVYRRESGAEDFRLIGRVPKLFRVAKEKPGKDGMVSQLVAPTAFQDKKLQNGKVYEYRIRAVDNESNFSDFSDIIRLGPRPATFLTPEEILLLVNVTAGDTNRNGINDSEEVARYYSEKRKIPAKNIVRLKLDRDRRKIDYARDIQKPVQEFLLNNKLAGKIKCIVPCYEMPIGSAGRALDSKLSDLFDRFTWGRSMGTPNPYSGRERHFDGTYGLYLVTRLDGPSVEIAKSLVDKALFAEKNISAAKGTAYLSANLHWENTYKSVAEIRRIADTMGVRLVYKKGEFAENELPDDAYWYFGIRHPYKNPKKEHWPDGAVGAHLISDSFYKIRKGDYDAKYKSWVEGLLEKGITATFGAVIEPYLQGYTRPDIFFERYWSGEYTFAESFMMATPTVQWAMSAVGDPLLKLQKN